MEKEIKNKIDEILGEVAGYFMSQKGKCGDVIMPTEFLMEKSEEIKKALKQTREETIKEITARLEICLVENEDRYIIGNIKDLIYKLNNIK